MTDTPTAHQRGAAAEAAAAAFLERQGLSLVARNFRTRFGEIDLIMQDRNTVVFVEVRARARADFGSALESVTARKQQHLRAAAEAWLARHGDCKKACRFDIVALEGHGPSATVDWRPNAF